MFSGYLPILLHLRDIAIMPYFSTYRLMVTLRDIYFHGLVQFMAKFMAIDCNYNIINTNIPNNKSLKFIVTSTPTPINNTANVAKTNIVNA